MKKLLAFLVLFGAFALPGVTLAQDKPAAAGLSSAQALDAPPAMPTVNAVSRMARYFFISALP